MRLTPEAMKQLFQGTVEKIKGSIGDVLNSPDVRGKKYVLVLFLKKEFRVISCMIRDAK